MQTIARIACLSLAKNPKLIYPRNAMLARVLAMALCLSITSRCSIEKAERIRLVYGVGDPTVCNKEIQVPSKIRVLPFGTLLQTRDLENFATAYQSSKRDINLAGERWMLRA